MSESGVLIVRDDGVTDVHGLVEAVERLFNSLGIPTRDEPQQPERET
jgi:hypothetical protein